MLNLKPMGATYIPNTSSDLWLKEWLFNLAYKAKTSGVVSCRKDNSLITGEILQKILDAFPKTKDELEKLLPDEVVQKYDFEFPVEPFYEVSKWYLVKYVTLSTREIDYVQARFRKEFLIDKKIWECLWETNSDLFGIRIDFMNKAKIIEVYDGLEGVGISTIIDYMTKPEDVI